SVNNEAETAGEDEGRAIEGDGRWHGDRQGVSAVSSGEVVGHRSEEHVHQAAADLGGAFGGKRTGTDLDALNGFATERTLLRFDADGLAAEGAAAHLVGTILDGRGHTGRTFRFWVGDSSVGGREGGVKESAQGRRQGVTLFDGPAAR